MALTLISASLAFVLGFSAYRTGICTVAAVAEVISSGTARIFLGFLKVILWVVLINEMVSLWMPELARPVRADPVRWIALAGGFVFGVGAVLNDGCSFSTISKIAKGNLHVALTLPSFVAGVIAAARLLPGMDAGVMVEMPSPDERWTLLFVSALGVWALIEIVWIVLPALRGGKWWQAITASRYRLSTGAALIGICSGFLYAIHGRWAYSSKIVDSFIDRPRSQMADGEAVAVLMVALLAGAVASAIGNRQLSFSFAGDMWKRNIAGGFLMGFGAMMVPGGNGALILQDLPALSVNALLAYLAMVLGIALTLTAMKRWAGRTMAVSCGGDLCNVQKSQRKRTGA